MRESSKTFIIPGPYSSFFLKAAKHKPLFFIYKFDKLSTDKSLLAKAILVWNTLTLVIEKILFSPTLIPLSCAPLIKILFASTSLPETSIASLPIFSKYTFYSYK